MRSDQAFLYFKISLVGSIVLLSITFFLTYTLFKNTSDLRVLAQFYTEGIMNSNQQSSVIPFESEEDFKSSKLHRNLITEMLLRYYVETRYTTIPDPLEMKRRWYAGSPFSKLSTQKVYDKFIGGDLDEKTAEIGIVQTVDIISIEQDQKDPNRYTIKFDLYARSKTGEIKIQKKTADITIRQRKKNAFYTSSFSNPYGLIIGIFNESGRKE